MTGLGPFEHYYLSTACLHAKHDYCSADEGRDGPKTPQACKWCNAACVCPCHHKPDTSRANTPR